VTTLVLGQPADDVCAIAGPAGSAGVELDLLDRGDCERLRRFFYRLSPETRYRRFLQPVARPEQAGAKHLLDIDHHDREAVIATCEGEIIGVARYVRLASTDHAEVAVVVADAWQRQGIARRMLRLLQQLACQAGITRFVALILADNRPAIEVIRHAARPFSTHLDEGALEVEVSLCGG